MIHLILGAGEVGSAYYRLLKGADEVYRLDAIKSRTDKNIPRKVDVLHICLRFGPEFSGTVQRAIYRYQPELINNMATCPPGTTEKIDPNACHSTTRGLHPNLDEWIRNGPKHIGGPKAADVADALGHACYGGFVLHDHARTTEFIHIASNFHYACELMAADEIERLSRHYAVDYFDVMKYAESHNTGYRALGLHSKVRPVIYPPHGKIGGHCVTLAPKLIPEELHGPLMQRLASYG